MKRIGPFTLFRIMLFFSKDRGLPLFILHYIFKGRVIIYICQNSKEKHYLTKI